MYCLFPVVFQLQCTCLWLNLCLTWGIVGSKGMHIFFFNFWYMEPKMLYQIHSDHLWYVNLTGQGMPRLNIVSGCVSEGVSRWDWHLNQWLSKLPSPMYVGIIQSMEGLNRTERRRRKNSLLFFPCLTAWAGTFHFIFSRPWTEIYIIISPGTCRYRYRYGHRYIYRSWNIFPDLCKLKHGLPKDIFTLTLWMWPYLKESLCRGN